MIFKITTQFVMHIVHYYDAVIKYKFVSEMFADASSAI